MQANSFVDVVKRKCCKFFKKNKKNLQKNEKKAKIDLCHGGSMRSFGFKLPDFFMEYGPIAAQSIEAAKGIIRKKLGIRRLPPGFLVWDLSKRPLTRWRVSQ